MTTTTRIQAPKNFRHAGDLAARYDSLDPRLDAATGQRVDIDLRECEFMWPAAVLWCGVYALLAARRAECHVLVPANVGVAVYLKSIGLLSMLQDSGIELDDRGIWVPRNQQQHILPITRFDREDEVEDLANRALEELGRAGFGSPNLYPLVSEVFAELAINAVQHSESPVSSLGLIQFYEFQHGKRFVCIVADGGIGIRRSLERNPALRDDVPYDWVAVQLALRERVSGTGVATRGIGLFGVAEDMRKAGRQLIVHSGIGIVETTEEMESRASRTRLFPGTLVYASIPA